MPGVSAGKDNPDAFRAILKAVGFWDDTPKANGKLNGVAKPVETRWKYAGTMGSAFKMVRLDGPTGKRMRTDPAGVKLQEGEKWLPYLAKTDSAGTYTLIVEGEKTADAAARKLAGWNVCTWQRAARDTDWSFCDNHWVWIWPDNDARGFDRAREVAAQLKSECVKIVQAGRNPKDDAADFVARGDDLAEIIKAKSWQLDADRRALRPIVSISDDGLAECFQFMGIQARYNLRSQEDQFYCQQKLRFSSLPVKEWAGVSDRKDSSISEEIRKRFVVVKPPRRKTDEPELVPAVFGKDRWATCFNAVLDRAEVDPFRQWVDDLRPAQSERLNQWVGELFRVKDDSEQFIRWASRYLFLGAVQRTIRPGAKLDEIPVFVGEQGLGKSAIGRAILPDEFREQGHGDALVLADDPKKFAESLQGKIVVEASEMAGLGRADLERLKSNITRQNDGSVRMAYRRNPESTPRRAVFYGTSNETECLPNDSTGNRRFVVVELDGPHANQSVESYFDEHRAELWAAAKWAYAQGERANLPRDLFPAQRRSNEGYRRGDVIVEDEVARLNHDSFSDGATLKEITASLCEMDGGPTQDQSRIEERIERRLADKWWGNRLGKALRAQGWNMKSKRRGGTVERLWFPPV